MNNWWLFILLALFGAYIFVDILTIDDTKPKKYKKYTALDVDNNLQLFVDTLSYDEEMHIMMNWYLLNYPKRSISEANSFALGKMIDDDDGNTKYYLKQLLHYNRTLETPFNKVSGMLMKDLKTNMTVFEQKNKRGD